MTSEQSNKALFHDLYFAKDEEGLEKIIHSNAQLFDDDQNWRPLGETKSNFSVVKNQQSNPIAAIIEKVTNSIDAILTRKCYESGIEPTSKEAPRSMDEAIDNFFPDNSWDLQTFRRGQAEDIQIIADGN
ncbi:MAG: hypothetical protein MI749_01395, partial [Desulfovibrionales bacterium]|nr:hypothetical protein [Desulfovibrionales bacterium]